MNPYNLGREGWKTVRAAIRGGWGPTLRLITLMTVAAVIWGVAAAVMWLQFVF